MQSVDIFQFLNYREYLRSWFEARKAEAAWFSYKVMGDGVGLDQSQVYRILQEQLHISKVAVPRFADYLTLEGIQREYFFAMVRFGRATKDAEARQLFEQLLNMRGSRCRTLEQAQLELYREWYVPVVRSLIGFRPMGDDYATIGRMMTPVVPASKVKKAILLLKELGLVCKQADGLWHTTEKNLSTGKGYASLIVRGYQSQSLELAKESLERHDASERDVSVTNVAVDEQAFRDIAEILHECRRQVKKRVEEVRNPDRVLRLAHALFPVANIREVEE